MAPEVISDTNLNFTADYWSFGILLYQLYYHTTPFKGQDEDQTFDKIRYQTAIDFPEGKQVPASAKSLIVQLLEKNPEQRLGQVSIQEIMMHEYFDGVRWETVLSENVPFSPPIKPKRPVNRPSAMFATFSRPQGFNTRLPSPSSPNVKSVCNDDNDAGN